MLNLDYRRRSDRIKLFLITFGLCSLVSLLVVFLSGGFDEPPAESESQQAAAGEPAAASQTNPSSSSPESSAAHERIETKVTLSGSVLDKTKESAQKFTEAYYTYAPEHPEQYIENSKPYMAEDLYLYEKENIRRQTLDRETTTAIRSEVLPVDSYDSDEVMWAVIVTGEVKAASGEKYEESKQYFVTLREKDGDWKVSDFTIEYWGEE
ncbi:hypothetical protein [Paenibacillus lautus]|uniref:hypothetical protein n=1 Tax=Paenibacillus lautus TaxID=1401 RepID=UPI002DBB352F|nr:hypothetical protein [Paenibacillus lautus]MEC0259331.1 hypothetical protein [Paenibacillus lautus]